MQLEPKRPRHRPIHPEHILQVRLNMWVREAVTAPHEFMAFDRSSASGQFTHEREAAAGIRRGTPDTELCLSGRLPIWAELKDPRIPNLSDEVFAKRWPDQWRRGQDLIALGHDWRWFQSIVPYYEWLYDLGVPMANNARFLALHKDATVISLIEAAELKRGVLPKRLHVAKPSPTVSQVARAERARRLPL